MLDPILSDIDFKQKWLWFEQTLKIEIWWVQPSKLKLILCRRNYFAKMYFLRVQNFIRIGVECFQSEKQAEYVPESMFHNE